MKGDYKVGLFRTDHPTKEESQRISRETRDKMVEPLPPYFSEYTKARMPGVLLSGLLTIFFTAIVAVMG